MSTLADITLKDEQVVLPEPPVITLLISWEEPEPPKPELTSTDRAQVQKFISTWQFTYRKPGSSPDRAGAYRSFQAAWNAKERLRLTYFPTTQLVSVGGKETAVSLSGLYRAGNAVEAKISPGTEHSDTTGGSGPFGPEGKWYFTTIVQVISREISSLDRADFDKTLQNLGDSSKQVITILGR